MTSAPSLAAVATAEAAATTTVLFAPPELCAAPDWLAACAVWAPTPNPFLTTSTHLPARSRLSTSVLFLCPYLALVSASARTLMVEACREDKLLACSREAGPSDSMGVQGDVSASPTMPVSPPPFLSLAAPALRPLRPHLTPAATLPLRNGEHARTEAERARGPPDREACCDIASSAATTLPVLPSSESSSHTSAGTRQLPPRPVLRAGPSPRAAGGEFAAPFAAECSCRESLRLVLPAGSRDPGLGRRWTGEDRMSSSPVEESDWGIGPGVGRWSHPIPGAVDIMIHSGSITTVKDNLRPALTRNCMPLVTASQGTIVAGELDDA